MKGKSRQPSVLLFVLGAACAFLGAAFCALLLRGYGLASAYDAWVPTPAKVLASWIEEIPQPGTEPSRYEFRARYQFRYEGEVRVATRVRDVERRSRVRAKAEKLQGRFDSGREVTCYVNPEDPHDAILLKPTKAPGYTVWFPGLFVVGGLGMCFVALRRGRIDPVALADEVPSEGP